ncbi:class I SAM-dependent methyltransferase [Croceicoccus sp. Ery5]|uniref:class I SAM-dependent methyltransferase n=1 Tax=Croceicoccus sp. Ery5 TaxID=1703340 RepID=UPI001E5F8593|nr:class I SAM-dependent methyltransferase [Croceicoccus sp. Ery5]
MNLESGAIERAEREKIAHDQGLQRDTYNKVLRNAAGFYTDKRLEIIHDELKGKNGGDFLELGSSSWAQWIDKSEVAPGSLTCINISQRELDKGIKAAKTSRIAPKFMLMDANQLDFPDNSFDAVFGGGILHHIEFERALSEVRRVLKPGGIMLFEEPLNINLVGKIVRSLTPRARTDDERPLTHSELDFCAKNFQMRSRYLQFLSVPVGVATGLVGMKPRNPVNRLFYHLDEGLLKLAPFIGPQYRHVILIGEKTP